ncbi:DUF2487 family protein [Bacillus fonticola]|uniref:DUF2487 family protein n=1 Tax=Bacillus fonticola TaxID=2728853 RepID=UPI0014743E3D|nr:DUF2487 family protein [Bacillus fonticola]
MRWEAKDALAFQDTGEYVDTAIVPMIQLNPNTPVPSAAHAEYVQMVSYGLEKQLKGRIMLFPPVTYFEDQTPVIAHWTGNLKKVGFSHVAYLGAKGMSIDGSALRLGVPDIPLETMDETYKQKLAGDQVQQLLQALVKHWNT